MSKKTDDIQWITVKGRHIPLGAGESKEDAIKRVFGSKEKSVSTPKSEVKSEKTNKDATQKKVEDKKSETEKSKSQESKVAKKTETAEDKKQKQIADAKEKADKLNKEQEYQNSLRQGNKVTLKDGKMTFKGKPIEKANTSDAQDDVNCSLYKYLDDDGNISEERLKVHRQIIEETFGDHKPYAPGQEKKALFTGGGGAAGKGMFTKYMDKFYSSNDNPVIVDADEIKKKLKFADTGSSKLDQDTTALYHEESSALAKQIYATALQHNYPVLFDGTATGVGSALKKIKQAEQSGYKTEMNFLFSDYDTVTRASLGRYYTTNRLVPIEHQMRAHREAYQAVLGLNDKFDTFNLYDNRSFGTSNVVKSGYKPVPVATNTKGGELQIHSKKTWKDFSDSEKDFTLTTEKLSDFYASARAIDKYKGNDRTNNKKFAANYPNSTNNLNKKRK